MSILPSSCWSVGLHCTWKGSYTSNAASMTTAHLPSWDVKYYPKYWRYFPTDQNKLLELWDELGLPHKEKKQIYRPVIPFISFDVDPNAMTVSISDDRHHNLLDKVLDFAKSGKRRSLKDFQSLWAISTGPWQSSHSSSLHCWLSTLRWPTNPT